MRVKIVSTGRYLPEKVETARELAGKLCVTEDWIISRTGVATRHVADVSQGEMGARAAAKALGDGPPPDLIINASGVPHQVIPDTSVFLQQAMGLKGIPSFSIHATCLSFAVALHAAAGLISADAYRRVLIVSADLGTRGRNFDEPESASLFGDGAVHLSPIAGLSKRLVREMALFLGIDKTIVNRVPTAGLEPEQSDFKDLGYDYDVVELVTEGLVHGFSVAELIGHEQVTLLVEQQIKQYEKVYGNTKFQSVGQVVNDILNRHRQAKNKMKIVHPPTPEITLHYND